MTHTRSHSGVKGPSPRILIADDSLNSRELLRSILEAGGYEVIEAEDGEQAIGKSYLEKPDLIVLDLHLPKIDGIAVASQLRQSMRFEMSPMVALAATMSEFSPVTLAEAGFTEVLVKPIRPTQLRACVSGLLEPTLN